MKKKRLKKKLNLSKTVISKFQASNLKGGGSRNLTCGGSAGGPGGPTLDEHTHTVHECAPITIGCPIN